MNNNTSRIVLAGEVKHQNLPAEAIQPTKGNLESLSAGDYIKIKVESIVPCKADSKHDHKSSEAFWLSYKHSTNGELVARVENHLEHGRMHGIRVNDLMVIDPACVLAIIKV